MPLAQQQLDDAVGRRRLEGGLASHHHADVPGVQAVDVLLGRHGALHLELAEPRGHRQLHDDAVDLRIAVQPAQRREQLAFGHVGRQVDLLASDAHVGACLVLRAHVDARGLVVAHEDGGQARGHALVGERVHPLGYLRADLRGNGPAVQDPGGHGANPTRARRPQTIRAVSGGNAACRSARPPCRRLGGREHGLVTLRTAGVDHRRATGVGCHLERIGEREERVGGQHRAPARGRRPSASRSTTNPPATSGRRRRPRWHRPSRARSCSTSPARRSSRPAPGRPIPHGRLPAGHDLPIGAGLGHAVAVLHQRPARQRSHVEARRRRRSAPPPPAGSGRSPKASRSPPAKTTARSPPR